jgi:hypothetical protein
MHHRHNRWVLAFGCFATLVTGSATSAGPKAKGSSASIKIDKSRAIQSSISGQRVTLRVDADFTDGVILNKSVAAQLRLKKSLIMGGLRIGPVELDAPSDSARVAFMGGAPAKKRIHWFLKDVFSGTHGVVSPGQLPYTRVIMKDEGTGSALASLPVRKPGKWGFSGGFAELAVSADTVGIGLAFDRESTIISADAWELFRIQNSGRVIGKPIEKVVRYGIQRPLVEVSFDKPINVGGIMIRRAFVRNSGPIASAESPSEDSEEIIVTARKKNAKKRLNISIGSDALSICETIIFDNSASKLLLSCHG